MDAAFHPTDEFFVFPIKINPAGRGGFFFAKNQLPAHTSDGWIGKISDEFSHGVGSKNLTGVRKNQDGMFGPVDDRV